MKKIRNRFWERQPRGRELELEGVLEVEERVLREPTQRQEVLVLEAGRERRGLDLT
jgi:hypothetical protein